MFTERLPNLNRQVLIGSVVTVHFSPHLVERGLLLATSFSKADSTNRGSVWLRGHIFEPGKTHSCSLS